MTDILQISGVGLGALMGLLMYQLAANHMKKNSDALYKLAEAVQALALKKECTHGS